VRKRWTCSEVKSGYGRDIGTAIVEDTQRKESFDVSCLSLARRIRTALNRMDEVERGCRCTEWERSNDHDYEPWRAKDIYGCWKYSEGYCDVCGCRIKETNGGDER
jgi:hypothetical protein